MKKQLLKFWAGIALLAILNLIVFDVIVFKTADTLLVQYMPDDAYYYLSLARNFANLHSWTFDSGISRTSGFHPLLAYLLVLSYKIFQPGTDGFVRIDLAVSNIFTIFSALIVFWKGWKYQQPFIFASLAILLSTRNVLINSVSGVEWALTVFVIVVFCVTLVEKHSTRMGKITLFVLGLIGSLARADFGLLACSFVFSSSMIWFVRKDSETLKASISGLTGAIAGVGLVFLHNYLLTGQAVQSSALMKSHWMSGVYNWTVLLLGALGLLALLVIPVFSGNLLKQKESPDNLHILLNFSALFAWIGYSIFYSKNSDVQPWYSANILFSVFIFLCVLWNSIQYGWLKKYTYMSHVMFIIIFVIIFLKTEIGIYPLNEKNSQWPHQRVALEAGKYLHDHPISDGRIGAWNAGVINYYQGGHVINLDGLVNNDIYAFAVTNSSFEYIRSKNVRYVIDFDIMFTKEVLERSGYAYSQFADNLSPIKTFDHGQYPTWKFLTLYRIGLIK